MSSQFGRQDVDIDRPEGWKEEIAITSGRFRLYKTRVNGVMQLVKEPKEEFRQDLITVESLKKEFSIGYGLNHPGLPRYYAFEGGKLFQEFIEGETLRDFIERSKNRPADREFIITVLIQLLEVVCYLHEHGVVHLDIKPENVMITSIGSSRIKLIDLGASKSSSHSDTPGFTVGHMAPEQAEGNVNFYTDIYQVGLIAAELAPLTKGGKALKGFIRKSTAEAPSDRFGSAREALENLVKLKTRSARRRWLVIGLITMVVLVSAAVLLLTVGKDKQEKQPGEAEIEESLPAGNTPGEESVSPSSEINQGAEIPLSEDRDEETTPLNQTPSVTEDRSGHETASQSATTVSQPKKEIGKEEIDAYVHEVYERHLSPFLSLRLWDEEGNYNPELHAAHREALIHAYEECMEYCEKLCETSGQNRIKLKNMFLESMGYISAEYVGQFYSTPDN